MEVELIKLRLKAEISKTFDIVSKTQKVLEGYPRLSEVLRGEGRQFRPELAIAGWEAQARWVKWITLAMGEAPEAIDEPFLWDLGDGLVLQCHPDLVFSSCVWEIKSTHPQRFAFARVQPFATDVMQLQSYLDVTGKPKGYLLYEDRAEMAFAVHEVLPNPKIREVVRNLLTNPESRGSVGPNSEEVSIT